MAYTPTYTADDYAPIFIDSVGLVGATVNEQLPTVVELVMIALVLGIVISVFTLLFVGMLGGLANLSGRFGKIRK